MEWIILALFALGAYLLPSIIAVSRGAPSPGSTIAINVLLGWTLVGWAASLAMALRSKYQPTVVHVQQVAPGPTERPAPNPPQPGHPHSPTAGRRHIDQANDEPLRSPGESPSGQAIRPPRMQTTNTEHE